MRPALVMALCLLSACTSTTQPLAMSCIAARPASPVLPVVPPRGIYAQAQALLARDKLQAAYARQLEALLGACM